MTVLIRRATSADGEAIRKVHLRAFPTAMEAQLVERLVAHGDAVHSLVADDGAVVAHLLLSRMRAEADGQPLRALGLAPVAVVPDRQGEGIGSMLVEAAIVEARAAGEEILFLLGAPGYYGRFGFSTDAAEQFTSPYAGPYFQALVLANLAVPSSGIAEYAPAFGELG